MSGPYPNRDNQPPAEFRAFLIYYAGVMLREARARRGHNVDWMLRAAGKARRQAASIDLSPRQSDLFSPTPPRSLP